MAEHSPYGEPLTLRDGTVVMIRSGTTSDQPALRDARSAPPSWGISTGSEW